MRNNRRCERGVTLMEMLVVVAITAVVMIAAYEMMESAVKASLFVEAHNDMPVIGQKAVNLMQREMMQSRQVFESDTVGLAYRAALRTSGGTALTALQAPDSLMTLGETATQSIVPDSGGNRFVGNCLLIVRQLDPVTVAWDHDLNAGTPLVQLPVERYEFQYYYLVRNANRNFGGIGYYLDLMQARSDYYADYFQLNSLTAAQRADLNPRLLAIPTAVGGPLTKAWNPGQPLASAFYTVVSGGTLTSIASPTIRMNRIASILPSMAGGRISGFMNYSVGIRKTPPFPIPQPIPAYAEYSSGTPGYPSGFEVKMVGPIGARKVLVRLLLMANYGVGKYDGSESTSLTSVRF